MAVTIKDIANRVGKSVTTVSRALSGYDDVSPETRKLILQVAEELGYEPNVTARQLQRRRTDTIGLILPSIESHYPRFSDPFFSELLTGAVEETTRHGFDLLVSIVTAVEEETRQYLKFIRSRRVDGFIIVRTQRQDTRIQILKDHNFPFVSFGRVDGENDFPYIDEDGELGIRLVVNHLIELGHTRFACISEPFIYTKSYHRVQGFRKALEDSHLPPDQSRIIAGGFRQQSGWEITRQLLDLPDPPTAIVTVNDLLALGAMRAAQEHGLVVGQDISITGFDDILLAEYAHPPLTTVRQPGRQIGVMLAQMLIREIRGDSFAKNKIILKPKLIVRQSTGPLRR